jgi:hypothetical protein
MACMQAIVRSVLTMAVAGLGVMGCTSSSLGGAASGTGSISTTTASTTTTTVVTTTTTEPPRAPFASVIIPAPTGFSLSTRVAIHNGAVDAAAFNTMNHSATLATQLHFIGGYDVTYDSRTSDAVIDVFLGDFATSDDADMYKAGFSFGSQPGGNEVDPVILGAYDYNSPKANPDGGFEHGVIASRGNRVMIVDYINGTAPVVPLVATMAKQQYDRM